jgi:DNA-binding LacI/PurR family transcriptional regulator
MDAPSERGSLADVSRRPSIEREYLNLLRDYNAEGAVFAGSGLVEGDEELSASVDQARRRGMHVVALAPRAFGDSSVWVDNRAAAYDDGQRSDLRARRRRRAAHHRGPQRRG